MRSSKRRRATPASHEPAPSPAMKAERTIDTRAVVTPNFAMARRNHTSSYTMLHRPDKKKNREDQIIGSPPLKLTGNNSLMRSAGNVNAETHSGLRLAMWHTEPPD